jgi:hypothetical protein
MRTVPTERHGTLWGLRVGLDEITYMWSQRALRDQGRWLGDGEPLSPTVRPVSWSLGAGGN